MSLHAYQQAFYEALWTTEVGGSLAELCAQPGFSVYRNTVTKATIDALAANYPAVQKLVGEEWFRAAAIHYVRSTPPALPMLLSYGAGFADFLASFPPAAELAYLPAVASLDRLWAQAHTAADAPLVNAAEIAAAAPEALASLRLTPHPAAHWAWFDAAPICSLWRINRDLTTAATTALEDLQWISEGVLITRPHDVVEITAVPHSACSFLDACATGKPLASAAAAALASDSAVDLAQIMATLLRAGAFSSAVFYPSVLE